MKNHYRSFFILNNKILLFILFFLSLLPALSLFYLVNQYAVNVPSWDEWRIGAILVKTFEGQLTFNDLIAQHNESRLFFPRLIYIAFAYLTNWNIRDVILTSVIFSCVISFNLCYLINKTILGNLVNKIVILFLINSLIFSTIQFESWHSGLMLPNYISVACITGCLAITYTQLTSYQKLFLCSVLSIISTFSFANGIICWVIFLPALIILHSFKSLKEKRIIIVTWFIAFILNVFIYFYNYIKPAHHPSFLLVFNKPKEALEYLSVFTGASLGFGNLTASLIVGRLILLLFITTAIYTLINFRKRLFFAHSIGWFLLGGYAFVTSLATTAGRFGFGVEQALYTSRYTTHSIYLPIALIALIAIISNDIGLKSQGLKKKIIQSLMILMLVIFLVLHFSTYVYGYRQMILMGQDRLRNKACLAWINQVPEECLTRYVEPTLPFLRETANNLDKFGLIKPSLLQTKKLQDIEGNINSKKNIFGYFDSLEKTDKGEFIARGWAILPEQKSLAHGVILAYEDLDGNSIAFAITEDRLYRDDVLQDLGNSAYHRAGWEKTFPVDRLPKDINKISAWAFDANTGKAFRLENTHNINH